MFFKKKKINRTFGCSFVSSCNGHVMVGMDRDGGPRGPNPTRVLYIYIYNSYYIFEFFSWVSFSSLNLASLI